jgi:hypothetical protein
MRSEKHVHGFVVFVTILTGIIFVYEYFRGPFPSRDARAESATYAEPAVDYDVRLVSLDFINGKSYTTLSLKLRPGRDAPEKLLVNTYFYVPGETGERGWTSLTEIQSPFAEGRRVEVVATATCDWCARQGTPKAGYFADVYVSTRYGGGNLPETFGPPVVAAVPVVVQAERERRR